MFGRVCVGLICLIVVVGCDAEQVKKIGKEWHGVEVPNELAATLADLWNRGDQDPHRKDNCVTEMRLHFPESAWSRMERIIERESGGDPWIKNRSSSAYGCYQMLAMHDGLFDRGCGKYEGAHCQSVAARRLWGAAGWGPWNL